MIDTFTESRIVVERATTVKRAAWRVDRVKLHGDTG